MVSCPQVSPPKPSIHLSPIRATCPAHLILLDFVTHTLFGEQYSSLSSSLCSFLHSPVTSSLSAPDILLSILFSNILSRRSSLNVTNQVWATRPKHVAVKCKIYVVYLTDCCRHLTIVTYSASLTLFSCNWRCPSHATTPRPMQCRQINNIAGHLVAWQLIRIMEQMSVKARLAFQRTHVRVCYVLQRTGLSGPCCAQGVARTSRCLATF